MCTNMVSAAFVWTNRCSLYEWAVSYLGRRWLGGVPQGKRCVVVKNAGAWPCAVAMFPRFSTAKTSSMLRRVRCEVDGYFTSKSIAARRVGAYFFSVRASYFLFCNKEPDVLALSPAVVTLATLLYTSWGNGAESQKPQNWVVIWGNFLAWMSRPNLNRSLGGQECLLGWMIWLEASVLLQDVETGRHQSRLCWG